MLGKPKRKRNYNGFEPNYQIWVVPKRAVAIIRLLGLKRRFMESTFQKSILVRRGVVVIVPNESGFRGTLGNTGQQFPSIPIRMATGERNAALVYEIYLQSTIILGIKQGKTAATQRTS
jgi:deoxycytidine triphosphate deaminase